VQRQHLIVLGGLAAVTLAGLGGWVVQREAACANRLEQAAIYGDAQVRRNKAGQCYICRPGGPLYDIAVDQCDAQDHPYSKG
jgi:type II secretory pathway pseudopilin PulG